MTRLENWTSRENHFSLIVLLNRMKSKLKPTPKLLYVMTGEVTNGKRPHPKTASPLPQSGDGNFKVQKNTHTHTHTQPNSVNRTGDEDKQVLR